MFIVFCFHYEHLLFSNKLKQPGMNFIANKYLPSLLMFYIGLLHATV